MTATSDAVLDTDPAARAIVAERLRHMSPSERAAIVTALNRATEQLAVAGILQRHPDSTPEQVRLRLGVLRIGPDLMRDVFGWDADAEGR